MSFICKGFAANIAVLLINSTYSSTGYYGSYTTAAPTAASTAYNRFMFANVILVILGFGGMGLTVSFIFIINCLLGVCDCTVHKIRVHHVPYPYQNPGYAMNPAPINTMGAMPLSSTAPVYPVVPMNPMVPMSQLYMPQTHI